MKKFVVIYRVPVAVMEKWRKETPPEEMQKQNETLGAEMMAWTQKNKQHIVDMGLPLGKNVRLTSQGATPTPNDLNYYCIVEAESADAVVALFNDNPHIATIPEAYLDIMEVPHMGL